MIDIRTYQVPMNEGINYNIIITTVLERLTEHIQFEQIIDGDNKHFYRLRSIRGGIKLITDMPKLHHIRDLKAKGIGEGIRRRVAEILSTGTLRELEDAPINTKELINMSKVHGIGPKMLSSLYHKGIRSIDELRTAIEMNQVKVTAATRVALKYHTEITTRIPRALIDQISTYIKDYISTEFEICGSYRRGKATSGDIDVLVKTSPNVPTLKLLIKTLESTGFLVAKLSSGDDSYRGICFFADRHCRIDFLLTSEDHYYPALLHFTGSGLFNQIIRHHAERQGFKLSNHGLNYRHPMPDDPIIPKFKNEREIFDYLNVRYLDPTERDL